MSKLQVTINGKRFNVEVEQIPQDETPFVVRVNDEEAVITLPRVSETNRMHWIIIDNRPYEVVFGDDLSWVKAWSGRHALEIRDTEAAVHRPPSGDGRIKAPIPGMITQVLVKEGDEVSIGQSILVLEAMKMENEIQAPRSGFVTDLRVELGQTVGMGDVLVEIS